MRIYVAGPMYTNGKKGYRAPWDSWQCIKNAIQAGLEIYRKGHVPYIPHLNALIDIMVPNHDLKEKYDWVENWDIPWLESCDAIFYLGSSIGADIELTHARKLKKIIYYYLSDIPTIRRKEKKEILIR